jgi:imidazolonepropionase-like amidohydrolase
MTMNIHVWRQTMKYSKHVSFVSLLTLIISQFAVTQIPVTEQGHPIAITGATVITGTGDTLYNGTILFEEGKITALGTDLALPETTERYDASGMYVYPGLIHAFNNMGLTEIGAVPVTSDFSEHGAVNPNVRAEVAFHPESTHIPVARSHGIIVSVSSPSGGIISGTSAAMYMDGWTWESMVLHAPVGLVVTWPIILDEENGARRQLSELRDAFDRARAYKVARDAGRGHPLDMRWEAMLPVLDGTVPVIVHADDTRQIQDAVAWAEAEDLRLVLLGGRDAHYVTDLLLEKGIPVIVRPVLTGPTRLWQPFDEVYSLPSKLYRAGVTFAITGTYGSANAMQLRHHASTAAAFGLPEEEALRAITLYPAQILGFADRVGSLEVGKDASLLVADGNILDLRTSVEQVFIEGRKADMNDMQKRLFERYREKYRQLGTHKESSP